MTIDARRSAVLALHWQVNVIEPDGFFGPLLAVPVAESGVVARAIRFHDAAAAVGTPLAFTRFTIPEGEGELVRNTGFMCAVADAQESFRPDSAGTALIAGMTNQPNEVFDNQKLSGLAGNSADEWLRGRGIDTLYLTGVATDLTVEQTARHATDLGYTVHVVEDCVAAADPAAHAASLANLALTTAGSLTSTEVLG
ncbi:cysteine hydrolase [Tsukamurella sp. 8F]|uniref:cysteine hydrolase n=1 Tax=unclassified Tsukamurella TaxID=2633480 RepID=UPI0023BA2AA1|nr:MULTISPECIES: cysteine hydrolase [unclassified Tsukamurella]MDF0530569.1 cysteine hydrolase [Tsukamurella sp. 8J]MDF0586781.1 cysteine hydrolase [Tsukamurella sp. 8F]